LERSHFAINGVTRRGTAQSRWETTEGIIRKGKKKGREKTVPAVQIGKGEDRTFVNPREGELRPCKRFPKRRGWKERSSKLQPLNVDCKDKKKSNGQ